jgi:hypothetical protein
MNRNCGNTYKDSTFVFFCMLEVAGQLRRGPWSCWITEVQLNLKYKIVSFFLSTLAISICHGLTLKVSGNVQVVDPTNNKVTTVARHPVTFPLAAGPLSLLLSDTIPNSTLPRGLFRLNSTSSLSSKTNRADTHYFLRTLLKKVGNLNADGPLETHGVVSIAATSLKTDTTLEFFLISRDEEEGPRNVINQRCSDYVLDDPIFGGPHGTCRYFQQYRKIEIEKVKYDVTGTLRFKKLNAEQTSIATVAKMPIAYSTTAVKMISETQSCKHRNVPYLNVPKKHADDECDDGYESPIDD